MAVTDTGDVCRPMSAELWKKQPLVDESQGGRRTQSERSRVETNVSQFKLNLLMKSLKNRTFFPRYCPIGSGIGRFCSSKQNDNRSIAPTATALSNIHNIQHIHIILSEIEITEEEKKQTHTQIHYLS